jgi:hypothetical protein
LAGQRGLVFGDIARGKAPAGQDNLAIQHQDGIGIGQHQSAAQQRADFRIIQKRFQGLQLAYQRGFRFSPARTGKAWQRLRFTGSFAIPGNGPGTADGLRKKRGGGALGGKLVGQALIQRLHGLAAQDQRLQPSEISLQEQTWRGHGTSVTGALLKSSREEQNPKPSFKARQSGI